VLPLCVVVLLCLLSALCGPECFPLAASATLGVSEMPMAIAADAHRTRDIAFLHVPR
jgi:hypothetical protein